MLKVPSNLNESNRSLTKNYVFTPELCSEVFDHNYDYNRPLKETKLNKYMNSMENGTWSPNSVTIILAVLRENDTDSIILLNGQHTLKAQTTAGDGKYTYTYSVRWILCDSIMEVGKYYALCDTSLSTRTSNERFHALRIAEYLKITDAQSNRLKAAVSIIAQKFEPNRRGGHNVTEVTQDDEIRVALMEEYLDQAREYFDIIEKCTKAHKHVFLNASVMSAALVMLREHHDAAFDFFIEATTNDTSDDNQHHTPATRMTNYLMRKNGDTAVHYNDRVTRAKKTFKDMLVTIDCFNKHMSGTVVRKVSPEKIFIRMMSEGLKIWDTVHGPGSARQEFLVNIARVANGGRPRHILTDALSS